MTADALNRLKYRTSTLNNKVQVQDDWSCRRTAQNSAAGQYKWHSRSNNDGRSRERSGWPLKGALNAGGSVYSRYASLVIEDV